MYIELLLRFLRCCGFAWGDKIIGTQSGTFAFLTLQEHPSYLAIYDVI